MKAGAIDGSRCFNDREMFTTLEWDSVNEEDIVRVPHETVVGRQWCQDKESLREWFVKRRMRTNPSTNAHWSSAQLQFLEGFYLEADPATKLWSKQQDYLDDFTKQKQEEISLIVEDYMNDPKNRDCVHFFEDIERVGNTEPQAKDFPTEEAQFTALHYQQQLGIHCVELVNSVHEKVRALDEEIKQKKKQLLEIQQAELNSLSFNFNVFLDAAYESLQIFLNRLNR